MRFDRGLRSAHLRPYPVGYAAVPTDDVNTEDSYCQFGGVKDSGLWLTDKALPAFIDIRVRLTPIWVDNPTVFVKLDENAACPLYLPRSVFSEIRVEATGAGHYQKSPFEERVPFQGDHFLDYQLIFQQPFLYQKSFQAQPEGRFIQGDSSEMAGEGGTHLWAYGACQVGDDIHPFVFSLESLRDETIVQPSSLVFWRERGLHPSGEEGIFQDVFEEDHTRSLFESIEAGMSVIQLMVGIDESGDLLKIPYRSYQFAKNSIFYKKET